jgi:quinol monooxygenase YgiN
VSESVNNQDIIQSTLCGLRMRLISQMILTMAILASTYTQSAQAEDSAVYLSTYVEMMPNAVSAGTALLARYRDASRTQTGNLRFDVLREIARPNRFAVLEVWADAAALESHDRAASTLQFRERLKAVQSAPPDERVGGRLYLGHGNSKNGAGAIYVLTHVDVMPTHQDDAATLLKSMSVETVKDYGNISYEVLQQANRANHSTVIEEWTSKKAHDAHVQAAHTRAFREGLSPMLGALYDERLYAKVD